MVNDQFLRDTNLIDREGRPIDPEDDRRIEIVSGGATPPSSGEQRPALRGSDAVL